MGIIVKAYTKMSLDKNVWPTEALDMPTLKYIANMIRLSFRN